MPKIILQAIRFKNDTELLIFSILNGEFHAKLSAKLPEDATRGLA